MWHQPELSSAPLSLSRFVLLFLSCAPTPHLTDPHILLSTFSPPPYLTSCHSNALCSALYLLFLSSLFDLMNTISAPCVRGGQMREKRGEERGVIITGVEGLVLPLSIPLFSLFLKVNRSPFSLSHPQLNMCVERTHAGEQVRRCRWQRRSLRSPEQWVEMNGFGHTYWESDGKGQHGPRWFDTERLKLELIFWSGYHVSLLI